MGDEEKPVAVEKITVGTKVLGGILIHAIMLVIFFMSLKSAGETNAKDIIRCNEKQTAHELDSKLRWAKFEADLATINVRLAVLENQNMQYHERANTPGK